MTSKRRSRSQKTLRLCGTSLWKLSLLRVRRPGSSCWSVEVPSWGSAFSGITGLAVCKLVFLYLALEQEGWVGEIPQTTDADNMGFISCGTWKVQRMRVGGMDWSTPIGESGKRGRGWVILIVPKTRMGRAQTFQWSLPPCTCWTTMGLSPLSTGEPVPDTLTGIPLTTYSLGNWTCIRKSHSSQNGTIHILWSQHLHLQEPVLVCSGWMALTTDILWLKRLESLRPRSEQFGWGKGPLSGLKTPTFLSASSYGRQRSLSLSLLFHVLH